MTEVAPLDSAVLPPEIRARFVPDVNGLRLHVLEAGRTIEVPALFIAGSRDWGVYQSPGGFERMQQSVCTRMLGCHLIAGAGHWVQQEQPAAVADLLLRFLRTAGEVMA